MILATCKLKSVSLSPNDSDFSRDVKCLFPVWIKIFNAVMQCACFILPDSSANGPKSKFAFLEVQVKRLAKGKVRSTYTYHYIGCFRDKGIDRDLDGHLWVDADMGPGACSRRCRHKGFTFAGIQASCIVIST